MYTYTLNEYEVMSFSSMSEVASFIKNTPDIRDYSLTKKGTLGSPFYGCKSYEEFMDGLLYGNESTTEEYINNLKNVEVYTDVNEGIFRDTEGFAYDMGSVVEGEPECCINSGAPVPRPTIKVYIDIGYSGSAEPKSINNRGYAIVKLLSTLVAQGVILDVSFIHFIRTSGIKKRYCAQTYKIDPGCLSLASIGFAGTTAFYRVVSWLVTAIQNNAKDYEGDGTSSPSQEVVDALKKEGALYIPAGYKDSRFNHCDKEEAEDIVTEIYNLWLKKQGKKGEY